MERTEIKPLDPNEDNLVGTNLGDDTWVPFNDQEPPPQHREERLPPRPEHAEMQMMQQQQPPPPPPQYYEYQMQPPPPPSKPEQGLMQSIQQTPTTTLGIVFAVGLILGYMFSNRRPIVLGGAIR